jgi:serine/threonine protein kinase
LEAGSFDPDPAFLQKLPSRYQLCEQISRGGQATVYRGRDLRLDREVAIKVGHHSLADDTRWFSQTLHEGTLLARIHHPGLARVYDIQFAGRTPYLVMEFVEGVTLREFVQQRKLHPRHIQNLLLEIGSALSAAHRSGVLHLDLKPENVIVTPSGHCRLIDFGMGWLLSRQQECPFPLVCGTPGYMAPEQYAGQSAAWNEQTDIFGMGGLLYFLLTGSAPWPEEFHETDPPRAQRRLLARLQEPDVDRRLARICSKSLALVAEDRYPSVEAFSDALVFRNRVRQRILASVQILLGCILIFLGIFHPFQRELPGQDVKHPMANYPKTSRLMLELRVRNSEPNPPHVLFWSPAIGLQPLTLQPIRSAKGKNFWELHALDGNACLELSDPVAIAMAFESRHSEWPKLRSQLRKLARPSDEEWSAVGARTWILSDRHKLTPDELPSGEPGRFLFELQRLLSDEHAPFACLVIVRGDLAEPWPQLSQEFDIRRHCDRDRASEGLDRGRHRVHRKRLD